MTQHSPLGASGAERWMKCPGSVRLLQHLQLDESDEEDWTKEGTAAHEAAAWCLEHDEDAWERVGQAHNGITMTAELVDPIQTYLDYCRSKTLQKRFVEYRVSSPAHPLMFGTLDHGGVGLDASGLYVDVDDFKFGAGLYVEIEDKPQLKYYAFCLIDGIERQEGRELPPTAAVNLTIVQPRITWIDPVRTWSTTVYAIKTWAHGVLIPAMKETELSDGLDAGPWCRFCPAKIVCPLLTGMFRAGALANPKHVEGIGMVTVEERARLMGEAIALLAPTTYNEPFGAVVIEANLCGTPAITTDWGSFPELIENGVNGYRCNLMRDFLGAIKRAPFLSPTAIRERAVARYSLDAIRPQYAAYLDRIAVHGTTDGWYSK